jgi:16S rRNA (cytosine1402-N4)-methyltransferase
MNAVPGLHRPVLAAEAIDALAIRPEGIYVDGTFGRGGHSRLILERLGPRGRLIALDRDPQAVAAAGAIADSRFCIRHASFGALAQALDEQAVPRVQGLLFDLGLSSPQLDDPARGFSFRAEGPLDMRMDPSQGIRVAEWLAAATETQLREVIGGYGEERFAKQIAAALVAARRHAPIRTTRQLADLVGAAVRTREPGQDPATRTFQALRIFVNRELEEVSLMLPQALERLAPGGRLALIAFHSLEDRLVKRFFQACARPLLPRDLPVRASELPEPLLRIMGRPVRPSRAEVEANPRARSAVLRVAERTAAAYDPSLIDRIEPDAWRS